MNHQESFEKSLINFLSLSEILDRDLENLLKNDDGTDCWKRNFIRSSVALVEGYSHCFKEFCQVSRDTGSEISKKRLKTILNEGGCSAADRIKLTIQAAYDVFDISPSLGFGGEDWVKARGAIEKRSLLMHPKQPQDLEIDDEKWNECYAGITWLLQALSSLISESHKKYR